MKLLIADTYDVTDIGIDFVFILDAGREAVFSAVGDIFEYGNSCENSFSFTPTCDHI